MADLLERSHICTQNLYSSRVTTWFMITSLRRPRRQPFYLRRLQCWMIIPPQISEQIAGKWEIFTFLNSGWLRAAPWTPEQRNSDSLIDSDSPPWQRVIYNHVCCKTSRAGAGIKMWPETEAMDHHKSALIECKLWERTSLHVSIHHENKACTRHADWVYVHVCVNIQVFVGWSRSR